jgi:NPCBM-associated, NEW3 domain of alpha-galactosidase
MIGIRGLLYIVGLLMFLPAQASAQAAVTSTTSVGAVSLVQITDFSVTPTFTSQNQLIDFSVTVKNTGNLPINATPLINVTNASNITISNITFTPVSIAVGNNATFIASWNTNNYPLGDYSPGVLVYYGNKTTPTYNSFFKIQSVTPPSTSGSGGSDRNVTAVPPMPDTEPGKLIPPEELLPELPPLIPPEEQTLDEGKIGFVKYPVILEIRPGGTATADILVSNIGDANITPLSVEITGVPREWVEVMTEDIELKAGDFIGINMGFSVPAGAWPGNYRVTVVLKSGDSEARMFLILRVKPYPAKLERPVVTRRVVVDTQKGTSTITLEVENAGRFIKKLEVVEEIPKDLASNVDQVDFGVPPSEIIESDPVVKWALEDIDFYEIRTIDYVVHRVLEEYSAYVNWPLRQLNIFYSITPPRPEVEISNVETSTLYPGKRGNFSVTVSNTGRAPLNGILSVELLLGWGVGPENITLHLNPSEERVLSFTVYPPESATLGVYTTSLKMTYNGGTAAKDVILFVKEPPPWESPIMLWIISLLLIIILTLTYLRRKKDQI